MVMEEASRKRPAGRQPEPARLAGGKFEGVACAHTDRDAPRRQGAGDLAYAAAPVEKHHVDRIAHEGGVHGSAGRDEQRLPDILPEGNRR